MEEVNVSILFILTLVFHQVLLVANLNLFRASPLPALGPWLLLLRKLLIRVVIEERMEVQPSIEPLVLVLGSNKIIQLVFSDLLQVNHVLSHEVRFQPSVESVVIDDLLNFLFCGFLDASHLALAIIRLIAIG